MNPLFLLVGMALGTYLAQKDIGKKGLPWTPLLLASGLLLLAVVFHYFGY